MSTLVIGREIVAEALRSADARPYIEAGLTLDFMRDQLHPAYAAVFQGQDCDAWLTILRHQAEFSKVPDVKLFRQSFPDGTYDLPVSRTTAAELVALARDAVNEYETQVGNSEAGRYIDAGDYESAAEIMLATARKVLRQQSRGSIRRAWDNPDYDLEQRLNVTVGRGPGFGIPELDYQDGFSGFQDGQLITVLGRAKANKALALDTPIPTPTGWTTMGEIREGDWVLGSDGNPARVFAATPVQYNRNCYEVAFRSGEKIVADADHLWVTERQERSSDVRTKGARTTTEIRDTLTIRGRTRHRVAVAEPLTLPEADLPVDAYVLGYWLGDGHSAGSRVTVDDADAESFKAQVTVAGYHVLSDVPNNTSGRRINVSVSPARWSQDSLTSRLRNMGVLGTKHVPATYLRASAAQRLALLQGLMDSDGCMTSRYDAVFVSTNAALASAVAELVYTLGMRAQIRESRATLNGVDCGPSYRVTFVPNGTQVFRLARKASNGIRRTRGGKSGYRYIESVTPVASVPVRCIAVDSKDRTYLAGKGMIPTHNTTLLVASAFNAWMGKSFMRNGVKTDVDPRRVMIVTTEITEDGIRDRLTCYGAGVDPGPFLASTEDYRPNPQQRAAIKRFWDTEVTPHAAGAVQVVQPLGRYTVADIEMDAEGAEPAIIYIDGFYFLTDPATGRMGAHWEAHDNLARELKSLAMRLNVPVFVTHQAREKQLGKAGGGLDDSAMMGGTGLRMASDLVVGLDKDKEGIVTINNTASRSAYLRAVRGEWNWSTYRFDVHSDWDPDGDSEE